LWNGEKALEFARISLPDFVTLDIEMPGMGGIATLKALRELAITQRRPLGVLLVSSHTRRGAAITIEGLKEGAFDFITKPDGPDPAANALRLREMLLAMIDAFRSHRIVPSAAPSKSRPNFAVKRPTRFRGVVIGSSTGGPAALDRLLPVLAPSCPVPIFLVQHFPEGFTQLWVESVSRGGKYHICEARDGLFPEPGVVYVGPFGRHLVLNDASGKVVVGFTDSPPENKFRPSVDVLFRSAAVAYSGNVLAIMLTGMGSDGAMGAAVLKRAGGYVVVQNEATSVVWGMPGSVVEAGAANEILPLEDIGLVVLGHLGIGG
jgi:two-component system chemotaxis response regulator CheB